MAGVGEGIGAGGRADRCGVSKRRAVARPHFSEISEGEHVKRNTLSCPAELSVLLHYHYGVGLYEPRSAVANESEDHLIEHGLLEMIPNTMQPCNVRITDMGEFFVHHLMTVPFPVATVQFSIPEEHSEISEGDQDVRG
jgi:hypothetical protein